MIRGDAHVFHEHSAQIEIHLAREWIEIVPQSRSFRRRSKTGCQIDCGTTHCPRTECSPIEAHMSKLVLCDLLHELAQIAVLPRDHFSAINCARAGARIGVIHPAASCAAQIVLCLERFKIECEIEDV